MNSGHDVGGMQGFGAINAEAEGEEPAFHADWERRAFAICVSLWSIQPWPSDRDRYAIEQQHPVDYWRNSYYENWLAGLERLLVEYDVVSADELHSGNSQGLAPSALRDARLTLAQVHQAGEESADVPVENAIVAKFKAGDRVRAVNHHPIGHTRAPRYIRGKVGVIDVVHGEQVFADKNADGIRELQTVYAVRFEARELWGTSAKHAVYVDLWDDHLEAT